MQDHESVELKDRKMAVQWVEQLDCLAEQQAEKTACDLVDVRVDESGDVTAETWVVRLEVQYKVAVWAVATVVMMVSEVAALMEIVNLAAWLVRMKEIKKVEQRDDLEAVVKELTMVDVQVGWKANELVVMWVYKKVEKQAVGLVFLQVGETGVLLAVSQAAQMEVFEVAKTVFLMVELMVGLWEALMAELMELRMADLLVLMLVVQLECVEVDQKVVSTVVKLVYTLVAYLVDMKGNAKAAGLDFLKADKMVEVRGAIMAALMVAMMEMMEYLKEQQLADLKVQKMAVKYLADLMGNLLDIYWGFWTVEQKVEMLDSKKVDELEYSQQAVLQGNDEVVMLVAILVACWVVTQGIAAVERMVDVMVAQLVDLTVDQKVDQLVNGLVVLKDLLKVR